MESQSRRLSCTSRSPMSSCRKALRAICPVGRWHPEPHGVRPTLPPEMQMRSYDWAVADRVPVVETTCSAVFPVQGNRYS